MCFCYVPAKVNQCYTVHMLLKKSPMPLNTNGLHEINYDPCLTLNSAVDNLHILNKDECKFAYESKHKKPNNGHKMMIIETKVNFNRPNCSGSNESISNKIVPSSLPSASCDNLEH